MNVRSMPQYSKAVKGFHIDESKHKLIYVYPMLFDGLISREYTDILREFMAISILKELFVSNSINMVSMASHVYPLTDERGKSVDTTKVTGEIQVSGADRTYNREERRAGFDTEYLKQDLKDKIRQKSAMIKQLLIKDPNYSQLKPFIEFITMENMIDVPVIVGTKNYTVDSFIISFMMMIAIASSVSKSEKSYKLSEMSDVNEILEIVKKTKPEDAWMVLDNMLKRSPKEESRLKRWLKNAAIKTNIKLKLWSSDVLSNISNQLGNRSKIRSIGNKIRRMGSETKRTFDDIKSTKKSLEEKMTIDISPDDSFLILKAAKNNIEQTRVFFKFCLEESLKRSLHGHRGESGQIDYKSAALREPLEGVLQDMYTRFTQLVADFGNPILISYINVFHPINVRVDTVELYNNYIYEFLEDISEYINNQLKSLMEKSFGEPSSALSKSRELKSICVDSLKDLDRVASKYLNIINNDNTIRNPVFDVNELDAFQEALDSIGKGVTPHVKYFEKVGLKIFENRTRFQYIITVINNFMSNISDDLFNTANRDFKNFRVYNIDPFTDEDDYYYERGQYESVLGMFFYFLFLYSFQVTLCKFVDIMDVHIETAKNDVLALPNYSLVIPVETIMSIANAFVSKSWKDMISEPIVRDQGITLMRDLNTNNIKGIVKFMSNRLNIPNLFVIDNRNDVVFIKLMYQSSPIRMNLKSIKTFNNHHKDKEMNGYSQFT